MGIPSDTHQHAHASNPAGETSRTAATAAAAPRPAPEVVAVGELLVDFIQVGEEPAAPDAPAAKASAPASPAASDPAAPDAPAAGPAPAPASSRALFARAAGGAPANVAAACAALGMRAAFVGKVGADLHGRFLLDQLAAAGVDTARVVEDPAYATTMAFAQLDHATSELAYAFARKPGADLMLRADELDRAALAAATVVHAGTFSLVSDPARTATFTAVDVARHAGHLVSCDVNLRPHAWPDRRAMLDAAAALVEKTDLLKVSANELRQLAGQPAPAGPDAPAPQSPALAHAVPAPQSLATGAAALLDRGPRLVAVTCGADGALLATRAAQAFVPAAPVAHVVDTAGAGDTFWGAAIFWLLHRDGVVSPADLDRLTRDDLLACGRFASTAAACSIERRGALGSAPSLAQVEARLE